MGADASITITGTIQSEDDLASLVQAIKRSSPTTDWGNVMGLFDEDEIREHIVYSLNNRTALDFMENDRDGGEFAAIQAACREIGLSYVLDVDVDESESVPGNIEVWTPGMEAPRSFIGSEQSGGPFLASKELLPLVEAGKWDEIAELVRLSADPAASLPKALSAAFDYDLARAPSA